MEPVSNTEDLVKTSVFRAKTYAGTRKRGTEVKSAQHRENSPTGTGDARNGENSSILGKNMGRNTKTGKSAGSRETPVRAPVTPVTVKTAVFWAKSWAETRKRESRPEVVKLPYGHR